jgi:hypothetical protein
MNVRVYGTVEHWALTTKRRDGTVTEERFYSWEAVTDAFHETKASDPLSAVVYAVQRRGQGRIKTWEYESKIS